MPRAWKPIRFRSCEGYCRLVEALARWRIGARVGVAKFDPHAPDRGGGARLGPEYAFRKVPGEGAKSIVVRGRGQRKQNRFPWNSGLSQAGVGGIHIRGLPRFLAQLYVGYGMPGVSWAASAPRKSRGQ